MIEDAIKTLLVADAAVKGYVDARVRPLALAQAEGVRKRPAIVYAVVASDEFDTFTAAGQHRRSTVEIASYADTFKECATLTQEVRRVLHHKTGDVVAAAVKIAVALLAEQSDIEQAVEAGTEKPVFIRTQTYRVLYKPI